MSDTFTAVLPSCYIRSKPRGPVFETTQKPEVAAPTFKRGFVTPPFFGQVRRCAPSLTVMGGMGNSVRTATRLVSWFQHPVHLLRLKPQKVASLIQPGIQTMTAFTQASRSAAPASPAMGTVDPIQLHADAHNALNMEVFYLRQPQANTAAARRKAIQALAALRGLTLALEG